MPDQLATDLAALTAAVDRLKAATDEIILQRQITSNAEATAAGTNAIAATTTAVAALAIRVAALEKRRG